MLLREELYGKNSLPNGLLITPVLTVRFELTVLVSLPYTPWIAVPRPLQSVALWGGTHCAQAPNLNYQKAVDTKNKLAFLTPEVFPGVFLTPEVFPLDFSNKDVFRP